MGLHWSEFDKFDELLDSGKIAAKESLKNLKSAIDNKSSVFSKLKQWLS